jgi:hypothetical protein
VGDVVDYVVRDGLSDRHSIYVENCVSVDIELK